MSNLQSSPPPSSWQKGIFTIRQLSYLYRSRKKKGKTRYLFKPELKALALRTGKTYVMQLPTIDKKKVSYFLDIESLPDEDFFYLFGIMLVKDNECHYIPFWSDTKGDELQSWKKAVDFLKAGKNKPNTL